MTTSFFDKCQFKIIQRQNIVINSFDISTNPNVASVADLSSWKIVPGVTAPDIDLYKNYAQLLEELKSKKKNNFGLYITTAKEVEFAAQYADFLYIPGEFCRQSDILQAAKSSKLPFFVEKGTFLSPNDITRLCEKIQEADYAIIECGSSFGYSNVVLDPRSLSLLQKHSCYFGISLSDLLASEGTQYTHKPNWLSDSNFVEAFIKTGKAFGAKFFVVKNASEMIKIEDVLNSF